MSQGQYDPARLRFRSGATCYGNFHEWAHVGQDARQTLAFRCWSRARTWWVLSRPARLLVEMEAAVIATREMRACRCWEPGDGAEALRGVLSYVRALFD